MRSRNRHPESAFTLAEVLAAMLLMAIVLPVAIQGIQIANRAGVVAERKGVALRLADQVLNESLVSSNLVTTTQNGNFGLNYRGYSYRLFNEPWSEDAMQLLTVEVFFQVQNREYSVRLSTLAKEDTL